MALVNSKRQARGRVSYVRMMLRLRIPLALAAMMLVCVGLVMNVFGVDTQPRPLATHPLTAFCTMGIALALLCFNRFGGTPVWLYAIGAIVIGICAARIMQAELTQTTGAPTLDVFGTFTGGSGQFSLESAFVFGAFAVATILRQAVARWGIVFLMVGLVAVYNTLLEVSYGMTFFHGGVDMFTLLAMMCLAVSLMALYVHRPIVRVALLAGSVGVQIRVMVLAVIVVPWAGGYVLHSVRAIDPLSVPFEALTVSAMTWSLLVIVLVSLARLVNTDVARPQAMRDTVMLNPADQQNLPLSRFAMSEALDQAWGDHKAVGTQFGLMILDVAYFRRVNETFGHGPAEVALRRVSETLLCQLRDHDALGRWSEDEFLILLKLKTVDDVGLVEGRLRTALQDVNSPFSAHLDGEPMRITPTFGTSYMKAEDQGPRDAVTRADIALHFAKDIINDRAVTPYELMDDAGAMIFNEESNDGIDEDARGEIAA